MWLTFAGVFPVVVCGAPRPHRSRLVFVGLLIFLVGGLSEFWEAIGGGRWTPGWLFVAKGGCGIALLQLYVWYRKTSRVPAGTE